MSVLSMAQAYADAGWYVFPIRPGIPGSTDPRDTGKAPATPRGFKDSTRNPAQLQQMFPEGILAVGLDCGQSGLLVLDEDTHGELDRWAEDYGATLPTTYTVNTGRGRHHYYQAPEDLQWGNRSPFKRDGYDIDVRGMGGYVLTAGSAHTSKDTRQVDGHYTADLNEDGSVPQVAPLPVDVRRYLEDSLHPDTPAPTTPQGVSVIQPNPATRTDRPGDQWEQAVTWRQILEPHGWKQAGQRGPETLWTRPGKDSGISATTGNAQDRDRLYVFTTNSAFTPETPYTKLGALAVLEFNGDHSAAARALAQQGYGTPDPIIDLTPHLEMSPAGALAAAERDLHAKTNDTPENNDDSEDAPAPSWQPVDLTPILTGTWTPPQPTLMPRTDGVALFYPGLVHDIHGESESGKSLITQAECARLLQHDQHVIYIDHESDPTQIVERLQLMGTTTAQIAQGFDYIRPDLNPYADSEIPAYAQLLNTQPTLVVIDGVTDALSQFGAASKDNDQIADWHRRVPRLIARRTGAAVILIDHVTKNTDTRGRFAIGGQTKMAAIDGASYLAEVTRPLGRGLQGEVTLRVAKDRPGTVRAHCGTYRPTDRTQLATRITVDSTDETRIVTTLNPPTENVTDQSDNTEQWRPTLMMEKLSRLVEKYREPVSFNALNRAYKEDGGKARRETILTAINLLTDDGYFIELPGPRNSRLFRSSRVYRADADGITTHQHGHLTSYDGGEQ